MKSKTFFSKVTALCACVTALPLLAATNITGDVVLDANADWRGLGTVTVEAGATLDLRGHNLQVTDIAGTGTITSDYGITPPAAPSIVSESAIFWLDAADESTIVKDASDKVTTWTSKSSDHRVATTRNSSNPPVYRRFKYGRPCVDFGEFRSDNNGADMTYSDITGIQTAFFVFKINQQGFFLGDDVGSYNFHRGNNGAYAVSASKMSRIWNGLTEVPNILSDVLPDDSFQTIAVQMSVGSRSNCLTIDRKNSNVNHRSGGRQICEIILFSTTLTDEQREEVTTYLQNKWAAYDAVPTLGELHIDVAANASSSNTTVPLAGNVRLVKDGPGTFTMGKTGGQFYNGGTLISGGTLMLPVPVNNDFAGWNSPLGLRGTEITVAAGAVFEMNGVHQIGDYDIVLGGGTVRNTGRAQNAGNGGIRHVKLTADSTFDFQKHTSISSAARDGVFVDLGGNTLTVKLYSGGACAYHYGNCTYSNGVVDVVSGGTFSFTTGTMDFRAADLRVNSALGIDSSATLNASNYLAKYSYQYGTGSGALNVYGTFTPTNSTYFYGCTMQNGSTIDLSFKDGVWNSTVGANVSYKKTVGYASGATVKIDVHGRTFALGDQIIAWTSRPENVTFVFDDDTAQQGVAPVIANTGLYYGADPSDRTVFVAYWTGDAGNGNIADPGNWACTNAAGYVVTDAVPGSETTAHLCGNVNFDLAAANPLGCYKVIIDDVRLTRTCDWSGLGANYTLDGTIDLNGHDLTLTGLSSAGTITSTYGCTPTAPSLVTDSSMFWLDAADASTIVADANGGVSTWTSKSGDKRTATTQYTSYKPIYKPYEYGRPCIDFGDVNMGKTGGSGVDMTYSSFSNIRTAFFVFKIDQGAFFLGGSGYNFHRGDGGKYAYSGSKISKAWNGLDDVGDVTTAVLPDDSFQVVAVTTKSNSQSDRLCRDNRNNVAQRTGGRKLCELILYSSVLSDSDRATVTRYLMEKWAAYDNDRSGELHLNVASGKTLENSSVAFTGNMKVVKDGTGTYVASKSGQSYIGGTTVREGLLKCGLNGTDYPLGDTSGDVTISTNGANRGTLDTNAKIGFYNYNFVLDGGKLQNTGGDIGTRSAQLASVRLTADSEIAPTRTYGFIGDSYADAVLDLGGHTLTVNIGNNKYFWIFNTTIKNGFVDVKSGGYFQTGESYALKEIVATNVDFRINSPLKLNSALSVRDYESLYNADTNAGTTNLNVFGTFKPSSHDYYYGCTLQDGSTIDFTSRTNELGRVKTLNETSAFTAGKNKIDFADGATVSIRLGGLRASSGGQLIAWASTPENVTFKSAEGERKYCLVKKSDGLYLQSGFVLIVR